MLNGIVCGSPFKTVKEELHCLPIRLVHQRLGTFLGLLRVVCKVRIRATSVADGHNDSGRLFGHLNLIVLTKQHHRTLGIVLKTWKIIGTEAAAKWIAVESIVDATAKCGDLWSCLWLLRGCWLKNKSAASLHYQSKIVNANRLVLRGFHAKFTRTSSESTG